MFTAENVSKSYKSTKRKHTALHPVNLSIKKGEIFGIIGKSGVGKSTLLRCLSTLTTPSEGKILFQGKNLADLSPPELKSFRQNIGMIFQQFNLFNARTVFQNIAYPLEIHRMSKEDQRGRVDELLEFVGLTDKRDAYPANLSGGQKQRVAIARALSTNPEVLFCDEATSALDPETTDEILKLLQHINKTLGITIILITHDMSVVDRICHRVQELKGETNV
jgi:D-methionine transport system ATP-binding protein